MEYKPLVFSRFETRFLRLVEHDTEEAGRLLRFNIETGTLSDPPDYFALSYCWGDVSQRASVEISGKIVEIMESLQSALYHSGLVVGDFIWADAICINQDDLYEKSYQVNMMGQIYAKAKKVIAWLGTESQFSRQATSFLQILSRRLKTHLALDTCAGGDGNEDGANLAIRDVFLESLSRQSCPPESLHGLAEILSRPYWERVWIIQEISKTSAVDIRCGSLQFGLKELLYAGARHGQLSMRIKSLLAAISDFREQELRRVGRMPLLHALLKTRCSLATDERNKVFALLGLAGDSTDLVPTPTYEQSIPHVFEQLTKKMMESHDPGSVILLVSRALLSRRFPTSSLWAVDWAELAIHDPEWLVDASISTQPSTANPATLQGSVLTTYGRCLGRITSLVDGAGSWDSYRSTRESDLEVTIKISKDVIERLRPLNSAVATIDSAELAYALARMISDADNGTASTSYNLHRVHHTLYQLKDLLLHGVEIWEWARRVNFRRVKESQAEAETLGCWNGVLQLFGRPMSRRMASKDASQPSQRRLDESADNQNPAVLPTLVAFKLWEDVLAGFNVLPEHDLQFAILDDEHLIVVTERADVHNVVHQLKHCSLPVVQGLGRNVGEAYVGRQVSGKWLSQVDPSMFGPDQTRSLGDRVIEVRWNGIGHARLDRMEYLDDA